MTKERNEDIIEFSEDDEKYMKRAMELAHMAEQIDEVPVGALIVRNGEIIAEAYNTRESSKCATHHAEILAIERACERLGGWRLIDSTLYVTMEPCVMCAGAIINARIQRVVYGTKDYRFGAMGSLIDVAKIPFNPIPSVSGVLLEEENKEILSNYFKKKRKN